MDKNIQLKQSIINSIVHSKFRLASAFAIFFNACLVTFAHILSASLLFVSFTIFRTVSKVKEKWCFSKKFCKFKILFEWEICLHFFYTLKWLNEFQNCFLLWHHTQIPLSAQGCFFHCLSLSGFSFISNPHSENVFLILGNTRFHSRFYIWIVASLKSTTR